LFPDLPANGPLQPVRLTADHLPPGLASSLAAVTTAPIVLVPGFWLAAWAWDDVAAALRADDHDVTAITLPKLESAGADRAAITLSDHATNALDPGFGASELPLPSWQELEAGGSSLEGLSDQQLAAFRERAVPEPGAALRETPQLADERRLNVPSTVVCASMSSDQIKAAVEERHPWVGELAQLRSVSYVDLPTGHWPMWSRARELAAILGDVARRGARDTR
jgi:hypothetical protein